MNSYFQHTNNVAILIRIKAVGWIDQRAVATSRLTRTVAIRANSEVSVTRSDGPFASAADNRVCAEFDDSLRDSCSS